MHADPAVCAAVLRDTSNTKPHLIIARADRMVGQSASAAVLSQHGYHGHVCIKHLNAASLARGRHCKTTAIVLLVNYYSTSERPPATTDLRHAFEKHQCESSHLSCCCRVCRVCMKEPVTLIRICSAPASAASSRLSSGGGAKSG